MSDWIPIDEFLEDETEGLCWIKQKNTPDYKTIKGSFYYDNKFCIIGMAGVYEIDTITHVMPILKPLPPEIEE